MIGEEKEYQKEEAPVVERPLYHEGGDVGQNSRAGSSDESSSHQLMPVEL
jgi:hypothetical protein